MHDEIFDSFARTQVQFPASGLDRLTVDAHVALLDKIGTPVILITHSLGGAFGWSIADARPREVAAIVALEPAGPPLHAVDTAKQSYTDRPNLPWGLTNLPLMYEPAIRDPGELQVALDERFVPSGQVGCYLQTGTPRRLSNLASIPVLLISGQASYHRIFDACTARWLSQAGVPTEYLELESVGLTGNGHEMMLEKNQADIARHVAGWLAKKVN
jgi:pimeloyl-ACP methyl ester carboxylesterase